MRHWMPLVLSSFLLVACEGPTPAEPDSASETVAQSAPEPALEAARDVASTTPTPAAQPAADTSAESARARAFFDETFMAGVQRNPMFAEFLGIRKDNDKWPNLTPEFAAEGLEITKANLKRLCESIDVDQLDESTRLSYELFERRAMEQIDDYRWRDHNYPVSQMRGLHAGIATHLINIHRVTSTADAEAYIKRLQGVEDLFDQLIVNLERREHKGIMAPKFVYAYVIGDSRKIITGAPFDDGPDSTLWADFKKKVGKLDIDTSAREALLKDARKALLQSVQPAYEKLIAFVRSLEARATTDDGAWKLPDGNAYYANALQRTTTTDLTAEEIHELGLREVARIHDEMREIMKAVGYEGTLNEFFEFMRTDKQFYYDDTPEGRQRYLDEATALIDTMRDNLDRMFIVKPKAQLQVKAVEPFREASAGKAFYNRPAPDGSRPGTYYANLYRMSDMPIYQMEALAYHEGIPGHHMQIAIALELEDTPMFRKWNRVTAYSEGWGLYTEQLPKEFGFYEDPYSDFGRLAMELWRACRLVVDTGIHDKTWSREQAIEYLSANSPNPYGDVVKAIERYIVMPSQATAYKIGMIKILELRAHAREQLGEKFDIREFHDVVLKNGPVPLAVLENLVNDYITETKG
jgi:uncharacterized protein (DUF885 family)